MRDHLTLLAAILAAANGATGYTIQEKTGMKPSTFDSKTQILLKTGAVEESAGRPDAWACTIPSRRGWKIASRHIAAAIGSPRT